MTSRARHLSAALALLLSLLAPGAAGASTVQVAVVGPTMDVVTVSARSGQLIAGPWGASGAPDVMRACPSPLRIASRAAMAGEPAAQEWTVLVRTVPSRKMAESVLSGLRGAVAAPLSIEEAAPGLRIVAGPFGDEAAAQTLAHRLRTAGMPEAAAKSRALAAPPPPGRLVALTPALEAVPIQGDRLVVRAEGGPEARVLVNGSAFRGTLVLTVDEGDRLLGVNGIELEDYLRGVVPKEMGPEVYPEQAALEAQAVAARTYALRQLGRHASDGYDLCATPHCQAYGGAEAEHPMSDAAVAATAGLVLTHEARLANTLYSSTCGGRTEAVENVFEGGAVPYLRSVECYPELVSFHPLSGRAVAADWPLADGTPAHDVLARLVAVGVVTPAELDAGGFVRRARGDESAEWLVRAARIAHRSLARKSPELEVGAAIDFIESFLAAVGWDKESALLAPQDLAAASRFVEFSGLQGDSLVAAFLALKNGLLPAGLTPGWGVGKLSRGNTLEVIELWLRTAGAFDAPPMRFVSAEGRRLTVLQGKDRAVLELPETVLFVAGRKGLAPLPVARLDLKLGDKLRTLGPSRGTVAYLALEEDPDGAANDRLSAWSWWTRRIPVDQIAREAASRAGLEGLSDVRVTRVSPAGRFISLELQGARGATRTVTGFAARQVLGLPEMRAHVELERDAAGKLTAVIATGRGWGHGVGLCQTGAFGMALAGATTGDILARYYPGTTLLPTSALGAQ